MRLPLLVAALLLASGQMAAAHGVWVAQRWGGPAIVHGHGASDDPYDAAKVTRVTAVGEEGQAVEVEVTTESRHASLSFAEEPAAILVEFDNGFWTERQDGSRVNAGESTVGDAKAAGHYVKHNLTLVHAHGRLPELPAQALQIQPLANPQGREVGDALRVRVLFDGQPLAGAEPIPDYVNMGDGPKVVADAKRSRPWSPSATRAST